MVEQAEEIQTRKRYYITTAIDYSNGEPHIGHSLEKVVADLVARYHRLQGHDTCFSMGLQELDVVLYTAAESLRVVSVLLAPFLPHAADRMTRQLGVDGVGAAAWKDEAAWGSHALSAVVAGALLFPRIDERRA